MMILFGGLFFGFVVGCAVIMGSQDGVRGKE